MRCFRVLSTVLVVLAAPPAYVFAQCTPATFTVNSTVDAPDSSLGDGLCSDANRTCTLRAALEEANASSCEPTTIRFSIGSGYRRIDLNSSLPVVTRTVVIDGYSQPGASPNTAAVLRPGNAIPLIELRGVGEVAFGLGFSCPDGERRGHAVSGLVLNGFATYAILNNQCDGASFTGNYIGVTASGQERGPGSLGIGIAVINAEDNAVGSVSPADRNVIAGATLANVYVASTSTAASFRTFDNDIVNNFIGTNEAGDSGIGGSEPVSGHGVVIAGPGASPPMADPNPGTPHHENGNLIGYNVIAGHEEEGIWLSGGNDSNGAPVASSSTLVVGNIVGHGTQATDFLAAFVSNEPAEPPPSEPSLRNLGIGILLGEASGGFRSDNNYFQANAVLQSERGIDILGGTGNRAFRNAVLQNRDAGIRARDFTVLTENSISDNGALGISMEVDEADPEPWITLDSLTDGAIEGSFDLPIALPPNVVCVETVIEIFASDSCDPSGAGEGREFLESLTFDLCTGDFTYVASELPFPRPQITATATWTLGINFGEGTLEVPLTTSQFSNCLANAPPLLASPIPDRTAEADAAFAFTVAPGTFVDPNGDTLAYSSTLSDGSPLPQWLTFVVDSGHLQYSGNPESSDVGDWSVRLTATDTSGASAAADFIITVVEPPPIVGFCGDPATLVHAVQGSGPASPLAGMDVIIEGVVVGDFQGVGALQGFFVQEEDADVDGDPATSEGLFVFDGRSPAIDVSVSDRVRVRGTVSEFFGLTELTNLLGVGICEKGIGGASPSNVTLPLVAVPELEAFEGMLVTFAQDLFVTGNFDLGRFGEVDLSVGGRLFNPTQVVAPGPDANALQDLNDRSRILLDDGSEVQNPLPLPPYLGPDGTLRAGDVTKDLTGVLSFGFGDYRLHPTGLVAFERLNERPAAPDVGGTLRIATFNVLNYFTTVDAGTPVCGPSGGQDCRGADSEAELERQRAKLVAALAGMDADVVGLVELENDPSASLEDLVAGVNGVVGPGTYDFVDTGTIGADAIKVGLIYKSATVLPTGNTAVLDDVFPFNANTRPPLAQSFEEVTTGQVLTVVVNHFKSKGSACDAVPNPDTGTDFIDPDTGDGQGNCNLTRVEAATRLLEWLATDPTGTGGERTFVVGDLNSYANEDPILVFQASGYTDLFRSAAGSESYTYVFEGQAGTFDYVLASPGAPPFVTGTAAWHVDADEPRALDYNDFNQPALFAPDPFRSSDHDPIVVGLDLQPMISVGIDIKPFFPGNPILPRTRLPLPVAILADEAFDPAVVDPETVRFGPAGAAPRFRPFFLDVNRDSKKDMILFFTTREAEIPCGAESASLVGFTIDGSKIEGSDAVRTLLCRPPPAE